MFVYVLSGCTSVALKHSTVAVSGTVSSILEMQALQNLGRYIEEGDAIPSMVALNQGTIQIQNKVTPGYKLPFHFADPSRANRELDVGLEMDWSETWSTVAVVNKQDLTKTRQAFRTVVENAQTKGSCDIKIATEEKSWERNKWLCVDPITTPSPTSHASTNWWVDKGVYSGHHIWVENEGFIDFVIALPSLQSQTYEHRSNLPFIAQ